MPELPEVETTRRGLAPHLEGKRIRGVVLRRPDLRWPIPAEIEHMLPGQRIDAVRRRAKYLLLDTDAGSAVLHLGMTGSLRVLPASTPVTVHDHVDLLLGSGKVLRFNDPRRFGCLLWQASGETHRLLRTLGPDFTLVVFGAAPAWAHSLPQVKVLQIGTGVHDVQDAQGLVTQRLDARPGTMVLVRPDQHLCARWRAASEAQVRQALAHAMAAAG